MRSRRWIGLQVDIHPSSMMFHIRLLLVLQGWLNPALTSERQCKWIARIHPSSHLSYIHPFISFDSHMRNIHPLTYEDEHADQKCYQRPGAQSGAHYIGGGVAGLDGSLCVAKDRNTAFAPHLWQKQAFLFFLKNCVYFYSAVAIIAGWV